MSYAHIKGVLFDLGSTLVEFEERPWPEITHEGQKVAYDQLVDSDHRLPDYETFYAQLENVKNGFRAAAATTLVEWRAMEAYAVFLAELGLDRPQEQSRIFMDTFYAAVCDQFVVCDGAGDLLRGLKRQGYRVGVVSNTIFPQRHHDGDLDRFGLMAYLDFRIYSSEFGFRKPHPAIYEEGLRQIGLAAEETLFAGDRYYEDVEGPQKLGMPAVLKYREGRTYPDPMPDGFPVIHSLYELMDILDIKR
jgi:putative hydrolase of the HAD superfamily